MAACRSLFRETPQGVVPSPVTRTPPPPPITSPANRSHGRLAFYLSSCVGIPSTLSLLYSVSTDMSTPDLPDLAERVRRLREQRQQGQQTQLPQQSAVNTTLASPGQTVDGMKNLEQTKGEARIVLAVDYGTTFTGQYRPRCFNCFRGTTDSYSGVAYARTTGRDELDLDDIYVVAQWEHVEADKVPSEFSYSKTKNHKKQYGYDIDDKSDVLARTKLGLEENNNRLRELKAFSDTLYGLSCIELNDYTAINHQIPEHLSKNAEDVVEDYLKKVADVTHRDIAIRLGSAVLENITVDLIITHPAVRTEHIPIDRASLPAWWLTAWRAEMVRQGPEQDVSCSHRRLLERTLSQKAPYLVRIGT